MSKKKPLHIDMIAGSQLRDTQGEMLSVEGADISALELGTGLLNDNHASGFYNTIGKITGAKKIMKKEDCENDRHRYFWDKVKCPYIYASGVLYDDEDHPNARAAAAILRNIHNADSPLKMKASVEGGVISRGVSDPNLLARTKITKVALTFTPANNATLVEPLNLDKSSTWEQDRHLILSVMHLAKTDVPSFRHITRRASANKIVENFDKIRELAKEAGLQNTLPDYTTESLIKDAVLAKVAANVAKINELIKDASQDLKKNVIQPNLEVDDLFKISKRQLNELLPNKPEVTDWISKNIPRDDIATWFARAYKKDPSVFSEANKQELAHHHSIASNFDSKLRLDKTHDFESGMKALKDDSDALSKKHAKNHALVEPSGTKFLDVGDGKAWYSLGKGSCSEEGAAMGHCGNEPSEVEGDNILSLRQEVTAPDGRKLHKPLTTAIENGGYLGETKGPANQKPKDKDAMFKLLSDPRIKGNIGGGYEPAKNFQFSDLSDEQQAALKHKELPLFQSSDKIKDKDMLNNPRFGELADKHNDAVRALDIIKKKPSAINDLPEKLQSALLMHSQTSPEVVKHIVKGQKFNAKALSVQYLNPHAPDMLMDSDNPTVRSAYVHSPHFKPEHADAAMNDPDDQVRHRYIISPHFKPEHADAAMGDKNGLVRAAYVESPHFQPKHADAAMKDESEEVRKAYVTSPHFQPKHADAAMNDSEWVRADYTRSPHFQPKHADAAMKDENEYVRNAYINSPHFKPEHADAAMNDKARYVRDTIVNSPHFKPEHADAAMNSAYADVRSAYVKSPHFQPKHADAAMKDTGWEVRNNFMRSSNFKPEHADAAMKDEDEDVRKAYVQSRHFQPKHADAAMGDKNGKVRAAYAKSDHFKPEHADAAMKDDSWEMRHHYVNGPNFQPKHADAAMGDKNGLVRLAYVESPHFKPEHADAAMKDDNWMVRDSYVSGPHFQPKHADAAMKDESEEVRNSFMNTPNFKPEMKKALTDTTLVKVVANVAKINELIKAIDTTGGPLYHIHSGGEKMTKEGPLSLRQINHLYGGVKKLEASGHVLVPHVEVKKALTAGYGGAAAPSARIGGAVLQAESLDQGRKGLQEIRCQQCGKDNIYMKHQTKCRDCGKAYPLSSLYSVLRNDK